MEFRMLNKNTPWEAISVTYIKKYLFARNLSKNLREIGKCTLAQMKSLSTKLHTNIILSI